jgi:hypothetical protein
MVPHHRDGGTNFQFQVFRRTRDFGSRPFPQIRELFFPNVPRDPIAGPAADDFSFGDELAPVNAAPKDYVMDGLIDAGDWLTRTLDAQGYRIDDTTGLAVAFVRKFLNSKSMQGKFAVGEYFEAHWRASYPHSVVAAHEIRNALAQRKTGSCFRCHSHQTVHTRRRLGRLRRWSS